MKPSHHQARSSCSRIPASSRETRYSRRFQYSVSSMDAPPDADPLGDVAAGLPVARNREVGQHRTGENDSVGPEKLPQQAAFAGDRAPHAEDSDDNADHDGGKRRDETEEVDPLNCA